MTDHEGVVINQHHADLPLVDNEARPPFCSDSTGRSEMILTLYGT